MKINKLIIIVLIIVFLFNTYIVMKNYKILESLEHARSNGEWLEFAPVEIDRFGRVGKQQQKLINMLIDEKLKKPNN